MAKKTRGVAFTNATIDIDNDTIIEERKEEAMVSSLSETLKEWDKIPGISLTIRRDLQTTVGTDQAADSWD